MITNAAAAEGPGKGTQLINIGCKGGVFPFLCFDNGLSLKTARDVFTGRIYKPVPILSECQDIWK